MVVFRILAKFAWFYTAQEVNEEICFIVANQALIGIVECPMKYT